MAPLQLGGVPGGPELVVIMLIFLLLFGIPIFLLGVGGFAYLRMNAGDDTQERIAELEAEIDHLKRELDAERDDQTASDGGTDETDSVDSTGSGV